jgi:hypothetical protein
MHAKAALQVLFPKHGQCRSPVLQVPVLELLEPQPASSKDANIKQVGTTILVIGMAQ